MSFRAYQYSHRAVHPRVLLHSVACARRWAVNIKTEVAQKCYFRDLCENYFKYY